MFYNRKEELKALNHWWKGKGSQLVVLYGKRIVGKTSLALKFIENKQAVYFLGDKLNINLQLKKLSQQIGYFLRMIMWLNMELLTGNNYLNILPNKTKNLF